MVKRFLEDELQQKFHQGKAVILMGARQVGKTTLLKDIFKNRTDYLWLNADEADVIQLFEDPNSLRLKQFFGDKQFVIIDEAQRIPNVGLKLKLITDEIPEIQLIATGSSSFELANSVNEPLTGRKWEYKIFPISFGEMVNHHGLLQEKRALNHRLVYGYYPDVINSIGNEKEVLKQLSDSFLFRDILMLDQIKKPEKIIKLLQVLAYQVGSQVSYNEIGNMIGLDSKTVEKYILVLEQSFVIFRLGSFSRNHRNELKNSKKVYFYDNGIRNALIANFSIAEKRDDIGKLWENFLISERIKKINYQNLWKNYWFWRTKEQKEIDWLEESDGKLEAFEFKWNTKREAKIPKQFSNAYPEANFTIITPTNYDLFLL